MKLEPTIEDQSAADGPPYRQGARLYERVTFTKLGGGDRALMAFGLFMLLVIGVCVVGRPSRFNVVAAVILGAGSAGCVVSPLVDRYRWIEFERCADSLEIRHGLGGRVRHVRAIPLDRISVAVVLELWGGSPFVKYGAMLGIVLGARAFEREGEQIQVGGVLNVPPERWREIANEINRIVGASSIS